MPSRQFGLEDGTRTPELGRQGARCLIATTCSPSLPPTAIYIHPVGRCQASSPLLQVRSSSPSHPSVAARGLPLFLTAGVVVGKQVCDLPGHPVCRQGPQSLLASAGLCRLGLLGGQLQAHWAKVGERPSPLCAGGAQEGPGGWGASRGSLFTWRCGARVTRPPLPAVTQR